MHAQLFGVSGSGSHAIGRQRSALSIGVYSLCVQHDRYPICRRIIFQDKSNFEILQSFSLRHLVMRGRNFGRIILASFAHVNHQMTVQMM